MARAYARRRRLPGALRLALLLALTAGIGIPVARAGAILDIADEIEHRVAPGRRLGVSCEVRGREVHLAAPIFDPARRARLDARFRRAFRRRLVVTPMVGS